MEGLFSWVRNFSYDLVALLLPGFLFIVSVTFIYNKSLPLELLSTEINNPIDKGFFILAFYILLSYVSGIFLKWCTTTKLAKSIYRKNLDNYGPAYMELYPLAKQKIESKFGLQNKVEEWPQFYVLVKTYIHKEGTPSTLTTFQNRYELSNSLSLAFFLLAVLKLALLTKNCLAEGHCCSLITQELSLLLLLALLVYVFYKSFRRYWIELGSQTIAQALIMVTEKSDE